MKEITYVCNRCRLPIKGDVYRLYAGIVDQETDELSDETIIYLAYGLTFLVLLLAAVATWKSGEDKDEE